MNGTFVNGVPVKQRLLEHGDQIEIGASKFLFLLGAEDGHGLGPAELGVDEFRLGSTVRLSPAQARYLQTSAVNSAAPATPEGRVALDLQVLLSASRVFASVRSVAELGEKLIELAFEAVAAERGALLVPAEGSEFLGAAHRDRATGATTAPLRVSRTVVSHVAREKRPSFPTTCRSRRPCARPTASCRRGSAPSRRFPSLWASSFSASSIWIPAIPSSGSPRRTCRS